MMAAFVIFAILLVVGAIGAMTLRNLIHCALSLVVSLLSLAGLFLQLRAEFVGFAQVLVYVGAVGILVVFAILLTKERDPNPVKLNEWSISSLLIGGLVFACIAAAVLRSPLPSPTPKPANTPAPASAAVAPTAGPSALTSAIGLKLMGTYVLPLEVLGLLLTAAMIGAVIIALPVSSRRNPPGPSPASPHPGEAHSAEPAQHS